MGWCLSKSFLETGKGNCNLEQLLQSIAPVELEAIISESWMDSLMNRQIKCMMNYEAQCHYTFMIKHLVLGDITFSEWNNDRLSWNLEINSQVLSDRIQETKGIGMLEKRRKTHMPFWMWTCGVWKHMQTLAPGKQRWTLFKCYIFRERRVFPTPVMKRHVL